MIEQPLQGVKASHFLNNLKEEVIARAKLNPAFEVTAGEVVRREPGKKTQQFDPTYTKMGPEKTGSGVLDPLTGEDAGEDMKFTIMWVFAIKDATPPEEVVPAAYPKQHKKGKKK